MTTIAWDGKTLAVDSKETCNGTVISVKRKKLYTNIGRYKAVVFAGDLSACLQIINWIADGESSDIPVCTDDNGVIAIDEKGHAYKYLVPGLVRYRIEAPYADGSGWMIALGAMDAGSSAIEAVKISCKRDVHTGGRVQSYTHSDKRKVLRPAKVGSISRAQAKKAVRAVMDKR